MRIEPWQIEMARRPPPKVGGFITGSTPVLSFGDPLAAEVATIGINPSRNEFADNGVWLTGAKRRLATLESILAASGQRLTEAQARQVIDDCNRYFDSDRNAYWKWFKPLDLVLMKAVGATYRDSSACHLDLVQWATDPVWGKLASRNDRRTLLVEGKPHLEALLANSNVHLVLAAGATVKEQLKKMGLVQWEQVGKIPMSTTTCTLSRGSGGGISYIGWSTNLQSQPGVSNEFKARLAMAVAKIAEPVVAPNSMKDSDQFQEGGLMYDAEGHLPPITKVSNRTELAALLSHWYNETSAVTIGDVGLFGGRPCISIDLGDHQAVLNVDTKRSAVAAYLQHVRSNGAEAPWRVVANTRGRVNKLLFDADPAAAAGWYAYLRKPLTTPTSL